MTDLCKKLSGPSSFLKRFTPPSARYDSVIEVLTIHGSKCQEHDIFDFPEVLRPYDKVDGWDYSNIFVDDGSYHEGHGQLYKTWGISTRAVLLFYARISMCLMLVRWMTTIPSMTSFQEF